MKVRSFSQQQRFVAISFALALACAIPMLVAETDSDTYSDPDGEWQSWAWVRNDGIAQVGDLLVSDSAHQYSIWNKHTKKLQFDIEYHHKVKNNNTGLFAEDMTDEFQVSINPGQFFVSTHVFKSGDCMANPGNYTFSAYTAARKGTGAKAGSLTDDITVP